jgi:type IV pilus assembly protein PilP
MSAIARSATVVLALTLLCACAEEISRPTSGAKGAPPAAVLADDGGVSDDGGALPKIDIKEGEFAESGNSRDPFRSYALAFADEAKGKLRSQRQVLLDKYSVDELKLVGIVTRIHPAKAMLVDPTGKGHVVQRGQLVGRAELVQPSGPGGAAYEVNWRVDRVRDGDIVLVREDPQNPDVPTATRVVPLRPEATLVSSD